MWFKDPRTQKKSITVTMLVITFVIAVASAVINLYNLLMGLATEPSLIWACLGLVAPFAGIYFQKRLKATATGVSFESETTTITNETTSSTSESNSN